MPQKNVRNEPLDITYLANAEYGKIRSYRRFTRGNPLFFVLCVKRGARNRPLARAFHRPVNVGFEGPLRAVVRRKSDSKRWDIFTADSADSSVLRIVAECDNHNGSNMSREAPPTSRANADPIAIWADLVAKPSPRGAIRANRASGKLNYLPGRRRVLGTKGRQFAPDHLEVDPWCAAAERNDIPYPAPLTTITHRPTPKNATMRIAT